MDNQNNSILKSDVTFPCNYSSNSKVIIFISGRKFDAHHRKYLLYALDIIGYTSVYIYLNDESEVTIIINGSAKIKKFNSIKELVDFIKQFSKQNSTYVIDAMGAQKLPHMVWIRIALRRYIWIYYVYDNFMYSSRGTERLKRWLADWISTKFSRMIMVTAEKSIELYPNAVILNNASHVVPINRKSPMRRRLCLLAALDRRTDFDFITRVALALPDWRIDIYGRLFVLDEITPLHLARCLEKAQNVRYRGPYHIDDIGRILSHYDIGFAAYILNDSMTTFVNPNKYWDYFTSGVEIITTNIAQAVTMKEYLHIVDHSDDFVRICRGLINDTVPRKNPGNLHDHYNWKRIADDFVRHITTIDG
jgi:hypothetical protein